MKSSVVSAGLFILIAFAFAFGRDQSNRGFVFGLSSGGGFTDVNFEKASGYSDDYLEDWGQGHFKVTLYGLLPLASGLLAGAEVGYNSLYWWYYRLPYGPYPVYRSAEWSTLSLLAMLRKNLGKIWYAQAGAGFHFFDGDPAAQDFQLRSHLGQGWSALPDGKNR